MYSRSSSCDNNIIFSFNFRDRCRTVVNVLGDAIGAGIVAKFARKELHRLDELNKTHQQGNNYPDTAPAETWNMTPI